MLQYEMRTIGVWMFSLASALLLLLGGTGCGAPACGIREEALVPGVPEYTLDNGIIAVKCVPAVSGSLTGFDYLPEARRMVKPIQYSRKENDLLPTRIRVSLTGLRELIWGERERNETEFDVRSVRCDTENAELAMYKRYFRNEDVEAVKTFSIRRGESLVRITLSLTRRGLKETAPVLWLNFIAELGLARDTVLLPVRGNVSRIGSRAMLAFPDDGVYEDRELEHQQLYVAPNRAWLARFSPERAGVLAMRTEETFLNGGYLLSWKHGISNLHTMEMIFPPLPLERNRSRSYRYECLYFPGLRGLRALSGAFGIDRAAEHLEIASAIPSAAGTIRLQWREESGVVRELGSVKLPALTPGKVARIPLKGKIPAGRGRLCGELPGGNRFDIFDLVKPR